MDQTCGTQHVAAVTHESRLVVLCSKVSALPPYQLSPRHSLPDSQGHSPVCCLGTLPLGAYCVLKGTCWIPPLGLIVVSRSQQVVGMVLRHLISILCSPKSYTGTQQGAREFGCRAASPELRRPAEVVLVCAFPSCHRHQRTF